MVCIKQVFRFNSVHIKGIIVCLSFWALFSGKILRFFCFSHKLRSVLFGLYFPFLLLLLLLHSVCGVLISHLVWCGPRLKDFVNMIHID